MIKNILSKANPVLIAAAALCVAAAPGVAMAATQGSLGATSSGSVSITASVPNRARLTGLSDVAFTNVDPATAASNAQNVCVWSNTATKAYTITASGSGTGSAFTLANGGLTVPYSVQWNASSGATSGTALTAGTASASLVSAATSQNCASGVSSSASLVVGIASTDLETMDGTVSYAGILTLLVTPQ